MEVDDFSALYPIGVVKNLTGLSERRLRYYEEQGLVHPQRTPGGQRLYAPADVDRLKWIKDLRDRGLSLSAVREVLARQQSGLSAQEAVLAVAAWAADFEARDDDVKARFRPPAQTPPLYAQPRAEPEGWRGRERHRQGGERK